MLNLSLKCNVCGKMNDNKIKKSLRFLPEELVIATLPGSVIANFIDDDDYTRNKAITRP